VSIALFVFALDLVPIRPLVVRSRAGCVGTHFFCAFFALFSPSLAFFFFFV
jgi:hypothetical protein